MGKVTTLKQVCTFWYEGALCIMLLFLVRSLREWSVLVGSEKRKAGGTWPDVDSDKRKCDITVA